MSQPPFPPPPPPPPDGPPPPPYGPSAYLPPPFPAPSRRSRALPITLAVLAAVFVLVAAIVVPVLLLGGDDDAAKTDRAGDRPAPETVDTSNLDAVEEYDGLTNQHLAAGEDHNYPQSPPVGGDHAGRWLECGVYDEPLPEVNVVHDLEHGTVWLTYREDDVDDEGVRRLAGQLPDNGILSPYPDQEAPVVITVWGRQLALTGPEDPRIALFIAEYGAGDTAPEPFASCHGGVPLDDLAGLPGGGVSA